MMTLDDIKEAISQRQRRISELEEENAQLRVRNDELIGERDEYKRQADQNRTAYFDCKESLDIVRAELAAERVRANGR